MVMLCFVLDLRSLSPPLLRDLKQSLLQLANFYAISSQISERSHSKPLRDRIGLCYVLKHKISCDNELKIAYSPRGNFSIRDFHHAVNNLPTDAFSPEFNNSGALCCDDVKLSSVLSDKVLYSWVGHEKDIARKVILISSCLVESLDSVTKKALTDAADKCVSVEFVLLEQKSSHLGDLPEKINNFVKYIGDLENCSFQTYFPDAQVLCALVKRWLQELKDDLEEQLQARFLFKTNLADSLNQIYCNLYISFNPIIDGFLPCQTCRCHGITLEYEHGNTMRRSSCPVTGDDLGEFDVIKNSVKVGENTILFMPSFQCFMKHQQVPSPIDFNVIERTNLGSLSEVFQGLCSALHSLDQGLVCSSNSNIETLRETSFQCYYILLPSNKGLMLLRMVLEEMAIDVNNGGGSCQVKLRLAGSEEVLPVPDVCQLSDPAAAKQIENSVQASLLEMEVSDYNPVLHERGFHKKLNLLVKESLQFGSLLSIPKSKDLTSEPNSTQQDPSEEAVSSKQATDVVTIEEEIPELDLQAGEDKTTARITEEWEQLVIDEVPKIYSPTCIAKPKLDQLVFSPPESNRQLDEKTSRILERLELPRQLKTKVVSPIISSDATTDLCMLIKKPLIPFGSIHTADHGTTASQPIKPNFQRIKRKQR